MSKYAKPPIWMVAAEDQHRMQLREMLYDVAERYTTIVPAEHYQILDASIQAGLQVAFENADPEAQQMEIDWYRRVVASVIGDLIRERHVGDKDTG